MRKLVFITVCVLFAFACSSPDSTTNSSSPTTSNTNAPTATTTPAPTSTTTATAEKIGVAECDDYIAAYDACVSSKVPEASRAQFKSSLEQARSSWRQLAANPQTKATLGAACKQALEVARTSLKAYGSTF
jgi:hypothetical protein